VQAALQSLRGLERPKGKRYTEQQQAGAVRLFEAVGSQRRTLALLKGETGYQTLGKATLRSWVNASAAGSSSKRRRGRPVNHAFEEAVLSNLLYKELVKVGEVEQVQVIANATYSYDVVREAALLTRMEAPWAGDPKIQKLKFSNKWVRRFLQRKGLHRRRVTAVEKSRPTVDEVKDCMGAIQNTIKAGNFTNELIISADETAVFFGAQPLNQYIPMTKKARGEGKNEALDGNGGRGAAPGGGDKLRYTALMFGGADGTMHPPFIIMKCSSVAADMSRVTIVKKIGKQLNEAEALGGGWELKEWQRELTLKGKGGKVATKTYKRPYLLHPTSLIVITCHHKAWMDSPGMALWADVQLVAWMERLGGKPLIVWDNCGCHKVPAVAAVFEEHGITTEALPKNMTDKLQVMDLVVNSVLKAAMRQARARALFGYYQNFKLEMQQFELERLQQQVEPAQQQELHAQQGQQQQRSRPHFKPPAPTLLSGLTTLFEVCARELTKEAFQGSMARTFVNVGLAPLPDGTFIQYTGKPIPRAFAPADMAAADETFQLHNVLAEVHVSTRGEREDSDAGSDTDGSGAQAAPSTDSGSESASATSDSE
jgi:hypothetical protein